ncbi:hypothetical protein MPTK1_5g09450 [Marchantia polymorpha subsp. ruderalis]|uniref:Thioredoxin domain-containing protein n=2 Tax=Marchantia polymorpha TaxID=3197 RepID=A0AAF6BGL3_MARPO|nr:hypothetical protein MARPO_0095s0015 [Marchantia polymorpha]BBN11147.1 hypothetical protein Mp_5g09450 [Marchantia polymorpha subsp. ruderalis]|eukprot:PTQ32751.1 hypothetical protein MARPO_0095s0015 [Marchantia polymorpha]
MSTWTIRGLNSPCTVQWNTRSNCSAPRVSRIQNTSRLNFGCDFCERSRIQESQLPPKLPRDALNRQPFSWSSRERRKGFLKQNGPKLATFMVQASLEDSEKQDMTDLSNEKAMDEELRTRVRLPQFCSDLERPNTGRSMMNNAFGGGYERDVIHKEIVRRMNSVGGADLDKRESFRVRYTTQSFSEISAKTERGPDDILALEDDRCNQLGGEQGKFERNLAANSHSMKKRRVPSKEHDEQVRWARRSLLNHCIPAILEKLGFNVAFNNLATNQVLSGHYNVNVTVSYEMSHQPSPGDGSQSLARSERGNEFLNQASDLRLFTTDSIRQIAQPVKFSTSTKGCTDGRQHPPRTKIDPSLRSDLYLDSHMLAPSPRRFGKRVRVRSPGKLWMQADGESNSPPSNMWRDLFTIIGLSAFIICGTYAFAVSNRYLKFGSKNNPCSMTTRHCGSDPHSTTTLKQASVIELSNSNFETAVTRKPTFVLFYAPWCSHCQQLEHTWKDLACRLPNKGYDVQLAQMDAEKYNQLAEKFKVVKYPTLIFFKDGKPTDSHTGPRDVDSLMTFIDENYM